MKQPNQETIRDEFERVSRMGKEALRRPAGGFSSRMKESQHVAMCLGAMQALAWTLGLGRKPSIEILRKVQEIDEQQAPSSSHEVRTEIEDSNPPSR